MGQQQLILLVLATVIVGLAIVVGIQAFTENSARANADAMMQDAVRIANDAQAAVEKPGPFGGVDSFVDVDFAILGYPISEGADLAAIYENTNGSFQITEATADLVRIRGRSERDEFVGDNAFNEINVVVCGFRAADIAGATTRVGGQATGAGAPPCPGDDAGAGGE